MRRPKRPLFTHTTTVEIGEVEYQMRAVDFTPGCRGDDPYGITGDCAEVERSEIVDVLHRGQPHDVVTFETLVREYAADQGESFAEAERYLELLLLESTELAYADKLDADWDTENDRRVDEARDTRLERAS